MQNAQPSKDGYTVEYVNENAGRELNEAEGVVCEENAIFSEAELPSEKKMSWLKNIILEYAKNNNIIKSHYTPALSDDVNVSSKGLKNDINHHGTPIRMNIISVIPDMLKNAVLIQTENNGANKTHVLVTKVRYGNERFAVGIVINENNGKFFYDHEMTEIEALADSVREETRVEPAKASVNKIIQKVLLSSGFNVNSEKNLRFSVAPQVDTPEFKNWFGDSKVVDENGNPLVVYRRDDENFTVFDFDKTQKTDAGWLGKGFYFYGDQAEAERAYGYGKNLRSFYLKAENPYYISQEEYNELVNADDKTVSAEFTQRLIEDGYDSVYWNGDLRQEWVVFNPTQIKSATDNVGTFDQNNPDIRFSVGDNLDNKKIEAWAMILSHTSNSTFIDPDAAEEILHRNGIDFQKNRDHKLLHAAMIMARDAARERNLKKLKTADLRAMKKKDALLAA